MTSRYKARERFLTVESVRPKGNSTPMHLEQYPPFAILQKASNSFIHSLNM